MRYWVGCTIKTIDTDLSCDIEIGHRRRKGEELRLQSWKKISGRLDLGYENGIWFYFVPAEKHLGVVLFPQKGDSDPGTYGQAELLVTLFDAPRRFAEKISCGESIGGEGMLHLTSEKLKWQMWYPCG